MTRQRCALFYSLSRDNIVNRAWFVCSEHHKGERWRSSHVYLESLDEIHLLAIRILRSPVSDSLVAEVE